MPVDYRFNPFTNTKQPVTISNEKWTIPSSSPFTIRLLEVPLKETPSTLTMRACSNLTAAIASSGQAYALVDDYAFFAINNICTIDNEKVLVTANSSGSSATTNNGAITTTTATTFNATSGAALKIGQIIKIDNELMLITNIATNVITVSRGYKDSIAATHVTLSLIYPQNELTILRGQSGTTAITHTTLTDIFIETSMSEVSSNPATGQYWPDYSTNADSDTAWNTGTILFNSADAGKKVSVNYKGMGSLADSRAVSHGKKLFTESGVFSVPVGVTQCWVSLCGGGASGVAGAYTVGGRGGGAGGSKIAFNVNDLMPLSDVIVTVGAIGGVSSFGGYVSCAGGSGSSSGGDGGSNGSIAGSNGGGGDGGSGIFGSGGGGGASTGTGNASGVNGGGYGAGGGGGYGTGSAGSGTPGMVLVEW